MMQEAKSGSSYVRQSEDNLEGDVDVPLAPVSGKDERRQLPRELFIRKPALFIAKITVATTLIVAGWVTIILISSWPAVALAMLVNGLMYAHLVELQHECLHGHAFTSSALNRLFGVLCGIFMMSSYSHYRYDHLQHHAYLGTLRNKEHFSYRFQHLDSVLGFARSFFDLSRFKKVAHWTLLAIAWRHLPGIAKVSYNRNIKQEYLFNFSLLVASILWTWEAGSPIFLLGWWLPALLVSEGIHFMIELPEHFGLNTQTDPNIITNTRTIRTSPLVAWFVNGNNIHTAHHYHQGVPMCNVDKLHRSIESTIAVVEPSYRYFYSAVIAGRIKQHQQATCMTR
jgi:fatty acid desaturase